MRFADACRELNCIHVNDGVQLASLTGLRREDLVTLTWDQVGDEAIIKKAKKSSGGKRRTVVVPRTEALDTLLVELKSRNRKPDVYTVLVNSKGQAWTGDGFGHSFTRVRDAAHIVHIDSETGEKRVKHIHDIRGTFCTKLIHAGLTNLEAAEIMGWSPDQVAGIRRTYVDQTAINVAIAARLRSAL